MVEILSPLAQAKLIIGIHRGNHENRIMKNTSIDITKIMAKMLNIPTFRILVGFAYCGGNKSIQCIPRTAVPQAFKNTQT